MISHIRNSDGRTLIWATTAAAVSVIVGQLSASWLNLCGTSWDSIATLALGFAASVMALRYIGDHLPQQTIRRRPMPVVPLLFAMMLIALSWLTPTLLNATLLAGCETIGSTWPVASILTMLFPALIVALVTATAGLFFKVTVG